jgi:hypothetical protein
MYVHQYMSTRYKLRAITHTHMFARDNLHAYTFTYAVAVTDTVADTDRGANADTNKGANTHTSSTLQHHYQQADGPGRGNRVRLQLGLGWAAGHHPGRWPKHHETGPLRAHL